MMMWPMSDDGPTDPIGRGLRGADDLDRRLARAVADRLIDDPRISRHGVTVVVQNRVVILSGTAGSRAVKQAAGTMAGAVDGVRDVCNALRVSGPDTSVPSHSSLRHEPATDEVAPRNGTDDARRFDETVARLTAENPTPARSSGRRLTSMADVVRMMLIALISVSMVALAVSVGWLGVLIACLVGALLVEVLS